jgi:hypothetical protein
MAVAAVIRSLRLLGCWAGLTRQVRWVRSPDVFHVVHCRLSFRAHLILRLRREDDPELAALPQEPHLEHVDRSSPPREPLQGEDRCHGMSEFDKIRSRLSQIRGEQRLGYLPSRSTASAWTRDRGRPLIGRMKALKPRAGPVSSSPISVAPPADTSHKTLSHR